MYLDSREYEIIIIIWIKIIIKSIKVSKWRTTNRVFPLRDAPG